MSDFPERYTQPSVNAALPTSASERISEIAEILAAGLMRLRARQSTPLSPTDGESSLDCAGHRSSHADRLTSHGGLD
jgi:hypothetical protein